MQPQLTPRLLICLALATGLAVPLAHAKPDRRPPANDSALTASEEQDLLHMYSEEKVAHDVYVRLGEKWPWRVFDNIFASETRHMQAVAALLKKYGLAHPTVDMPVGKFSDPWAQALYDKLLAEGSVSRRAAMEVGVKIETLDIADLEQAMKRTDKSDIRNVYSNLLRGSQNHLRAFTRQSSRR